jgi:hypothetical protein
MTIPMVALSPRRSASSEVRHLRLLIVARAIALLSSILILDLQVDAQTSPPATDAREDSSDATAVVAPSVKDKNLHLSTISKALVNEASRLKNDAAGWDQKLQELELDLNKNQQDVEAIAKDIADCLVVLRTAADRLAPDAEARGTFRQQEGALREVASRAEVHSDPAVRKTAGYFQRKTTELRALNRSVEETRIELITQIDRLEAQLEFNGGAGQMSELVRGGRLFLAACRPLLPTRCNLRTTLTTSVEPPRSRLTQPMRQAPPNMFLTPGAAAPNSPRSLQSHRVGLPPVARRSAGLPRINRPDAVTVSLGSAVGDWSARPKIPLSSRR